MTTVDHRRTARAEAAEITPFGGWEITPNPAASADHAALFRFPAADDPAPTTVRLLSMSLYAATLGLAGVGVGLCALVNVVGGAAAWFMPALASLGLSSVAGAVGAVLSIHRRALPWLLLLAATVPMAGAGLLAALY